MSWQTPMTTIVRGLINDLDSSNYSDSRVQQVILIAAQLVKTDLVSFNSTYTVNLATSGISPDPVDNNDDAFINLVSLKAACLFDSGSARTNLLAAGVRIVHDGDTIEKGYGSSDAAKILLKEGYCAAYQQARLEFQFGHTNTGEIIVGPYKAMVNIRQGRC